MKTKADLEKEIESYKTLLTELKKKNDELESKMQVQVKEVQLSAIETAVMQEVNNAVFTGIKYAVTSALTAHHNNPIQSIAASVLAEYQKEIKDIINAAIKETIYDEGFVTAIRSELTKKLAREMINMVSGSIESVINRVKQDPSFKANIILRVTEILDWDNHGGEK